MDCFRSDRHSKYVQTNTCFVNPVNLSFKDFLIGAFPTRITAAGSCFSSIRGCDELSCIKKVIHSLARCSTTTSRNHIVTSCVPLAIGTHIGAGRFVSPVRPFRGEFRLAIYHPALPRVATRQRKNLVLLLEAHLAFRERIPTWPGQRK